MLRECAVAHDLTDPRRCHLTRPAYGYYGDDTTCEFRAVMGDSGCELLMQAWFPAAGLKEQKPLHETNIRNIADVLIRD